MEKEDKLHKIGLLRQFCAQNKVSLDELVFLTSEMSSAYRYFPYEIFYHDGTISQQLLMDKTPIAVKLFSARRHKYFWAALKTTYPQEMTVTQARSFFKEFPTIGKKNWRFPWVEEMCVILRSLEQIEKLAKFYALDGCFSYPDVDDLAFGCMKEDKLSCAFLNHPGVYGEPRDTNFWWLVCDVD